MLAGVLLVTGCGGRGDGNGARRSTDVPAATEAPAAGASTPESPATEVPATEVPASEVPVTEVPATDVVPAEPWSATAADDLAALQTVQTSAGDVADVLTRLFGQPAAIPWPADGVLTEVWVTSRRRDDGTWVTDSRFTVATAMPPAELEALAVDGFADDRWESGARVESTLDSGVFVTLNYPASAAGEAEGWSLLAITVGPETDFGTATGRNQMEFAVEHTVGSVDDLSPTWFMEGWLAEMPVADGLELVSLDATDADTGVWMSAEYTAPADQFATLVEFYAKDHSGGALSLDASTPPADLSATDYFTAGFFPTLAGYDLFVTVQRDLADPAAPVTVGLSVRVEG